jgi:hypothetical protein
MPYQFTFDLSKVPRFFFTELARVSYEKGMHKTVLNTLQEIIKNFRIQEATGLNLSDAIVLLQDLIDVQAVNLLKRRKFLQAKRRAVFLPHCSRKYMDSRCKAVFDASIPSYTCSHCSEDCLVNKAYGLAKKKGYDVYVVPGGSCIPKILKANHYEGIVGVACAEEIKMAVGALGGMSLDVAEQAIPLIKNGCANTAFNMETLAKVL